RCDRRAARFLTRVSLPHTGSVTMSALSRRGFLGTSLAALAASPLFGQDKSADPPAKVPRVPDTPAFEPNTLFLTWQRDPTTTMPVQWVGVRGETADTNVYYAPGIGCPFEKQPTAARPYAETDFKVFRAELTGLCPGTDYVFR